MPLMATGFYIDGMNLFYGALKGGPHKWLDVRSLAELLTPTDDIACVRYFTARVKVRRGDDGGNPNQSLYLRALRARGGIVIHEGRMTVRSRKKPLDDARAAAGTVFDPSFLPAWLFRHMWRASVSRRDPRGIGFAHVLIEEEKQSDVSLAVHLVKDCALGLVDKVVVVSNDSDLADALSIAKSFGAMTGIVNPRRTVASRHLSRVADFEIFLRDDALASSQLPDVLVDGRGRRITRPWSWS